ncbi:MAG TPA: hypothetical protein VLL05_14530 [Terriglobales bacterium]|nr:hypothetical protein [Terriglobales bacterium]
MASSKNSRRICLLGAAGLLFLAALALSQSFPSGQDWTNYVRIGAYGLGRESPDKIVADATAGKVFGIEVDNDIPGRYESFLDPTQKLNDIHALAEKAHRAHNYAFVYIAGTECITANADKTSRTLAKEHPDWLQRKLTGEAAIFGGGTAFWIKKGDEDVWVSPYATEWRKTYMERVRQIAATGIDGIYIDIPYWMTHFDGWEDSWASFDDYTVAAFRRQTGLDARHDVKIGDFSDPNFRKWVDFRIATITDFLTEIDKAAKSVNPAIKTIPEIYPGIEEEATRVGADVYSIYPVVDAIAHEYEFGNGDHMASGRTPLDWFRYQVGMHTFRAFAQGKATWILNYSWDGDKNVAARDAMPNLAMSQIMDGANFWDAPGHSMAGSNDAPTRRKIFAWIAEHQATFYRPRLPIQPVGVYFSPKTRDYGARDFLSSYRGCLILLMQTHREFQVVTPRTLAQFKGEALVLPDVRELSDEERGALKTLASAGTRIITTGTNATNLAPEAHVNSFPDCPCRKYESSLDVNLEKADPEQAKEFLAALHGQGELEISASPLVATSVAMVEGQPHIFLANFAGLRGGTNPIPTPQKDIALRLRTQAKVRFLPFLGEVQDLRPTREGEAFVYHLPELQRGGVAWVEK